MMIGIQTAVKSIVSPTHLTAEDFALSFFFEIIPKFL